MTIMSKESIELERSTEAGGSLKLDEKKIEEEYQKQINHFVHEYENSDLRNDADFQVQGLQELYHGGRDSRATTQTGFAYQFSLLFKRNFLNIVRLPQTSYVKFLTTCITALFAILLFYNAPDCDANGLNCTQAGIQNIQGSLFFTCMNVSFNAIQNVVLIFPDERPVFLREVNNNMYTPSPYFWAKVFSELPFSIAIPSVFGCLTFFAINYTSGDGQFFIFLLILILIYNASAGYALIISTAFSNKQMAVTLTPILVIPF